MPILGHIIIESSSSNSPMFDNATLNEVDIDLLIHGVTLPEPVKFRPLTLFFRSISYLLLRQEVKHDVIRARIIDYIMDPNNFDKLRNYIPQHYPSGEAYIQGGGNGRSNYMGN